MQRPTTSVTTAKKQKVNCVKISQKPTQELPKIKFEGNKERTNIEDGLCIGNKPTLYNLLNSPIKKVSQEKPANEDIRADSTPNINRKTHKKYNKRHRKSNSIFDAKRYATRHSISIEGNLEMLTKENEYMIHTYCLPNALPVAHVDKRSDEKLQKTLYDIDSVSLREGMAGGKMPRHPKYKKGNYKKPKKTEPIHLKQDTKLNVTSYVENYKETLLSKYKNREESKASSFTSNFRSGVADVTLPCGLKIPEDLQKEIEAEKLMSHTKPCINISIE